MTTRLQPTPLEFPGWLSTAQAANLMHVTPAYVDRLLALGNPEFPAPLLLYGTLRLFNEAAIRAYLKKHPSLGKRRLTS